MRERGTADANSLRLFVAIEFPQEVREALTAMVEHLKAAGAVGAPRWVQPESMHITLKFLGATDEEDLPAIVSSLRAAVHGHGPFSLRVGGLGTFGAKRALRVVWAGLEGDADALGALAASVDEAMARIRFPLEARPFAAHLTLARVRDGTNQQDSEWLHSVVAKQPVETGPMFHVKQCVLMESTLQQGGAVYRALATFPLEGGE